MLEYQYFKQTGNPEIHAALVGISKVDWIAAEHQDNTDKALTLMSNYEFDILPKKNKDGSILKYYATDEWGNYENITLHNINPDDLLYYLTNIKDVIHLMYERNRKFFFLTNHTEVIGLITISNLNCKHVSLYFYNLISIFERKMGRFVRDKLSVEQILKTLKDVGESKDISSALDTVKRFTTDSEKGLDGSIVEYLYLSDLFLLAGHFKLYKELGYNKPEAFEKGAGNLRRIRNSIAHPNKSLIKGPASLEELWRGLVKLEELDEKLV